jgi:predicted AAA+ superfamily ATPase
MADTNNERVGKALGLLTDGLGPFVDRELTKARGASWDAGVDVLGPRSKTDAQFLLRSMLAEWNGVFRSTLGHAGRSYVSELIEARNKWAHQDAFSSDDAYRALDTVERLLHDVSAGEQAVEVGRMKHELQRRRYAEEARRVTRRKAAEPLEGMPSGNLKPWREVVAPHRDVRSGEFQQAEFAADLHEVWRGEADDEYGNPEEFFRRTFLTEGLRELLLNAAKRLGGRGGDPIVQLQTNFGGGKTHSLIALYHLAAGLEPAKLPGVEEMLAEAGVEAPPAAKRAVLVGHILAPAKPDLKPDGTLVHTLWGELAHQLGGPEGYALVARGDEARVNPGEALITLLQRYGPSLILIDEWVAYARQLYARDDLEGGTFDAQMTFAQALSDAARRVDNALLVVSIPASDIEVGGDAGREALTRLSNVFMRQETSWKPASPEEGFEIVRRRLFEEVPAELARERDAVVNAFADLYRKHSAEFPLGVREGDYARRIQAAYPIHPELFDKLFEDWSTLEKFQRTRGVLRLMASVIHELWERGDAGLMIMPASVPIDSGPVQAELTRYLEDGWTPVLAADVDGENALPLQLDRENTNFGRYSATRRVARTIYIGSAPTLTQTNKGIDDRSIKLGCVQPGEAPAVFGDALRGLSNRATYLVKDKEQYWYALGQTIGRTAADRAQSQFLEEQADEEIRRRLLATKERGSFAGVHWAPRAPGEVPDDAEARLVVLGPDLPHSSGNDASPARETAAAILKERAGGPRLNRNMLVFAAADSARLDELRAAARSYLAWKSIWDEKEELNLDELSRRQAQTQRDNFDETVNQRINETFAWALVPSQDKGSAEVAWDAVRVPGSEPLAVRVSKKLEGAEQLITALGGVRLRMELDRVPLWPDDTDHVSTQQLWSYFAQYLYLPRLRDRSVLVGAIETGAADIGWEQDTFAYAQGHDDGEGRYRGLVAGDGTTALIDGSSVLVKPSAARAQMDADRGVVVDDTDADDEREVTDDGVVDEDTERVVRRFYAVTSLDPQRVSRDADQIATEVITHLVGLVGANVEVKLELTADVPDGVPDDVVRTVTENAKTLKFEQHAFEES